MKTGPHNQEKHSYSRKNSSSTYKHNQGHGSDLQ